MCLIFISLPKHYVVSAQKNCLIESSFQHPTNKHNFTFKKFAYPGLQVCLALWIYYDRKLSVHFRQLIIDAILIILYLSYIFKDSGSLNFNSL